MSTPPHHVSDRAGDNLRKVISQIIDLACAVEFPIEVIEPRMHVELDVPQLAGDEAERSFELREPRLGEIDATLQVSKLFFQIDGIGEQLGVSRPHNKPSGRRDGTLVAANAA